MSAEAEHEMLPLLRQRAPESHEALQWLMASAREWARRAFMRRLGAGVAPDELEAVMRGLHRRQVAVLTRHTMLDVMQRGGIGRAPVFPDKWIVTTGILHPDATPLYLKVITPDDVVAGMMDTEDIMALPEEFVAVRWRL